MRAIVFFALAGSITFSSALAGSGGWIEYNDETSSRLIASPDRGSNDPSEKDYDWGDVDNDGDIDIVVMRKTESSRRCDFGGQGPSLCPNVLFMHEGTAEGHPIDHVFVDRTLDYAVASDFPGSQGFLDITNDRDVKLVDVNGDGWLDIVTATGVDDFLPKYITHPRIYINLRREFGETGDWLGFRHEDSRIPEINPIGNPGLLVAPRFCSIAVGDVDGDNDIDLYFGDYDNGATAQPMPAGHDVNDRLFINDGNGFFTDSLQTRMTGQMLLSAFGLAAEMADMNGDGFLDIVKDTALQVPQQISISYNDPGNEGFFDRFDVPTTSAPYHISVGDLNNDNRLDIVVTDDATDFYLLNTGNNGNGVAQFISRTFSGDDGFGGNSVIADLNNDNQNDVIITDHDVDFTGCNRRTHIYRNTGGNPVVLVEQGGAAPWSPQGTHDVAVFDINGDGWLDLFYGTCSGTEIWINQPPVGMVFQYPQGLPTFVDPDLPFTFQMTVSAIGGGVPQDDTGVLQYSVNGAPFIQQPMTFLGNDMYEGTFPASSCTDSISFFVSAELQGGGMFVDPPGAPGATYSASVALAIELQFLDQMEGDVSGWTVVNDPSLTTGAWEQADPNGTVGGLGLVSPEDDATGGALNTMAFVTQNGVPGDPAGQADVDGGPTRLTSPAVDLDGTDAVISFALWVASETGTEDSMDVEVSNTGGAPWTLVETVGPTGSVWEAHNFLVSDFVVPTADVRVRFSIADQPNNSLTEGGVDSFQVDSFVCGVGCVLPSECTNNIFCDGVEDCDTGTCVDGPDPCAADELCIEGSQSCVPALQPKMGEPVHGLTVGQLAAFEAGKVQFDRTLTQAEGLGPVFNQNSCASCHAFGGSGGAGSIMVTRFGLATKGGFDPLAALGGSLRQAEAIDPDGGITDCSENVPPEANVVSNRTTPSIFGEGLVEAVADADLLANETTPPSLDVSGIAHIVEAFEDPGVPRVGRFGWKAQVPTLLTFSADAALNEMGLTNRFVMTENAPNGDAALLALCDAVPDPEDSVAFGGGAEFIDKVTDFQRFLAAPPQTPKSGMAGEPIFMSIGCGDCHVPSFTTGTAPETALTNKTIKPYSDFLLHDMGSFGDGIVQGAGTEREMRTAPLWGVRVRNPMLHDGVTATGGTFEDRVLASIGAHDSFGSEAQTSAQAFTALTLGDQDAIVAFLDSLGRAEFDHTGDDTIGPLDFVQFAICYANGGPYTPDDACAISDVDQDGDVDDDDLNLFLLAHDGPLPDCNGNAEVDYLELLAGTHQDLDTDGQIDQCDAPSATADGGRAILVTPADGPDDVALLLTSPDYPCLTKYVDVDGTLVDAPVLQTPSAWATVIVARSVEIVPVSLYFFQAEFADGTTTGLTSATTRKWGDVDANNTVNLIDAQKIVQFFQGNEQVTQEAADIWPCLPNNIVNLIDAQKVVKAFQGETFSQAGCSLPCE